MPDPRIKILDSLRAFAALSVCFFHFICTTTGFTTNSTVLSLFSIGQYGVQLFFVISGFVIPWAMYHAKYEIKDFSKFFLKRITRLEPPYLFSILVVLIVLYIRAKYMGKSNEHLSVSAEQVALHLGYLIPFFEGYKWLNQVYWTLAIEFQYYLFIAFLFTPFTRSVIWVRILIYLCIFAACAHSKPPFLFYWLPLFLLGIILFMRKVNIISRSEYFVVTSICLAYGFYQYAFWAMIYAMIPIVMVLLYSNLQIWGLDFFGKFSYSIYLIHPVIGASLINYFSHHVDTAVEKVVLITFGVFVTVFFSWLTYLFIELPSKMLSSKITYRIKQSGD